MNAIELLIAGVIVFFMLLIVGSNTPSKLQKLQSEAVNLGYAHYNATNGVWEWKTNNITK